MILRGDNNPDTGGRYDFLEDLEDLEKIKSELKIPKNHYIKKVSDSYFNSLLIYL
jgi:hypothetical protein